MPLGLLFAGGFPWRFLIFIAGVALLGLTKLQHDRLQKMSLALEVAQQAVEDHARIAERLRRDADRANKVVANAAINAEIRRKEFSALRQEVYSDAKRDDGPLAPVLLRTFSRLPDAGSGKSRGN